MSDNLPPELERSDTSDDPAAILDWIRAHEFSMLPETFGPAPPPSTCSRCVNGIVEREGKRYRCPSCNGTGTG